MPWSPSRAATAPRRDPLWAASGVVAAVRPPTAATSDAARPVDWPSLDSRPAWRGRAERPPAAAANSLGVGPRQLAPRLGPAASRPVPDAAWPALTKRRQGSASPAL